MEKTLTIRQRILFRAAPPAASLALRGVGLTLRVGETTLPEIHPATKTEGGMIYAAWHSRLLLGMYVYRNHGINVLVSRSRDGELLTRALARFGFQTTRGSSSRGGIASLKTMGRLLENGVDVMVAPDGPRGPREKAKIGIIQLAALSGAPIVPWTWSSNHMKLLGSWDRLRLPLPFTRCHFWSGEILRVDKGSSKEELEQKRQQLEEELHRLTVLEKETFPNAPGIQAATEV